MHISNNSLYLFESWRKRLITTHGLSEAHSEVYSLCFACFYLLFKEADEPPPDISFTYYASDSNTGWHFHCLWALSTHSPAPLPPPDEWQQRLIELLNAFTQLEATQRLHLLAQSILDSYDGCAPDCVCFPLPGLAFSWDLEPYDITEWATHFIAQHAEIEKN
jgi:hypothetical protein